MASGGWGRLEDPFTICCAAQSARRPCLQGRWRILLKATGGKRLQHVRWDGRLDLDRRLRLRKRHDDLARQQLQGQVRARAIDRVAENRPALRRAMDTQLMRAAGLGLEFEPGDRRAAPFSPSLDAPERKRLLAIG